MQNCQYTRIDGIKLRYEVRGEGPCVLLLHGWGGRIESFAPVADFLCRTHRVVSLDFPGHGESDEPQQVWSAAEFAGITWALLQELGIERVSIVGHSHGGRVGILLAATHAEAVEKLVLCDSAGLVPKRGAKYYARVYSYKLMKQLGKVGFINRLFGIDERAKNAGSEDYKKLSGLMKATFSRLVNGDLRAYLKDIKAPTLLVWGSEDTDTPLYMGRIMEEEIEDSALIVFEGAGHFAYLDDLPKFTAILSSFLGG